MAIRQRGDIYICCNCGSTNVVAIAPRCPICGHENVGCCQQAGLSHFSQQMSLLHHHRSASHDRSSSSATPLDAQDKYTPAIQFNSTHLKKLCDMTGLSACLSHDRTRRQKRSV
ncbi:hypothetical protein T310_2572 [Rasamsonia emersonii CBS 393.64]|uniref:Uncharacterized protein n=1 Tax=Rasamsonia emersonii (strain ATCC 16479 / CBS 393.64 / IMI 116815) TaxID=1408163 RepID=A0A0F4YYS7_RASE3|nr:hypothetical protein T310_2572 [Rasamsonia emersonii CBS 393.64]KKA23399.1 hypothetical protein T310_2572 [Rasamsonia emersonii CBS 393.64]